MQLVRRALGVLRVVAEAEDGVCLKDLVDRLDIPLSSMHRLVAVLADSKCLTRSPTNRRYFLGPAAARFLDEEHPQQTLTPPHPAVIELRRRTGEAVLVTELLGGHAVCTTFLPGARPVGMFAQFGQRIPWHADASARVLLADQTPTVAHRMLLQQPLIPFTRTTPSNVEAVMRRLAPITQRGYDTSESELDEGLFVVGAPIRLPIGRVRAAVSVAMPSTRLLSDDHREDIIQTVLVSAAEMSSHFGYAELAA
ncbi:IclR family transcriptional regulator [Streptomyces rubiginosohelvolus]|uniref:IclR family transcriptional regulator n=1 Tax=Streptomyces rubiginosohelvolus TaxID=67362 RepID=UPI00369470A5